MTRRAALTALQLRAAPARDPELARRGDLLWIEAQYLQPDPNQPRKQFDEASLDELRSSLEENGVLTPLRVRPPDPATGIHTITDGERRWRAGQLAAIVEFPCLVEAADQGQAFLEAYLANLHRDALSPVDAAVGLQHIRETFGLAGDEEVAARLHKSVGWVRQMNAVLALDPQTRATLQERREPVAIAVGLRPQSAAQRQVTLEAIEGLPNRDAKVGFVGQVNEQLRGGQTIEEAVQTVRTARAAPPAPNAAPSAAPPDAQVRKAAGRPTRITMPFTWRVIREGVSLPDVHPSALATTRLAAQRTTTLEAWRDAVCADLVAFRDSCADVSDSAATWTETAALLAEVLGLAPPAE